MCPAPADNSPFSLISASSRGCITSFIPTTQRPRIAGHPHAQRRCPASSSCLLHLYPPPSPSSCGGNPPGLDLYELTPRGQADPLDSFPAPRPSRRRLRPPRAENQAPTCPHGSSGRLRRWNQHGILIPSGTWAGQAFCLLRTPGGRIPPPAIRPARVGLD